MSVATATARIPAEADAADLKKLARQAGDAAQFLKLLGNEKRLLVLCFLAARGEMTENQEPLLVAEQFQELRGVAGLQKKPSTSELIDWLKLLLHEDLPLEILRSKDVRQAIPPLHGALLKNEADVMMFERLAFLARRQGN